MFCRTVSLVTLAVLALAFGTAPAPAGATIQAGPQVAMIKKCMPAVVGIGVDKRSRVGYRFTGDNSFWDEFKKQYQKEQGEFQKKGKPQWDKGNDPVTPDDIEVSGTGFIVNGDGTIITAEHVINGHSTVYVTTWDSKVFRARVVRYSRENDVAMLKVENGPGNLPAIPMGDSDKVEIAETVYGIGNPFGISFSVTSGIVSALNRQMGEGSAPNLIQTDAPLNPGNSGGPLINADGEAVGVSHMIFSPGRGEGGRAFNVGLAFAVPINRARDLVAASAAPDGEAPAVYIGISLSQRQGEVVVGGIDEGSPAEKAGLREADLIVSADGKRITDRESLVRIIRGKQPDDVVVLKVERAGKRHDIRVIVKRKP